MAGKKGRLKAFLVGPLAGRADRPLLREAGYSSRDLVIAVDGGLRAVRALGLIPDCVIGDWDSLGRRPSWKVPSLDLPRNKDRSDLYYAADIALALGAEEVICLGVCGGRGDHHLAMVLDLAVLAAEARENGLRAIRALGRAESYHFLSPAMGTWSGAFARGRVFSVFSMGGGARGVSISGARFTLKKADVSGSSLGLSNVALRSPVRISLERGNLVVIVPRKQAGAKQPAKP